jgi:hypothetical protein
MKQAGNPTRIFGPIGARILKIGVSNTLYFREHWGSKVTSLALYSLKVGALRATLVNVAVSLGVNADARGGGPGDRQTVEMSDRGGRHQENLRPTQTRLPEATSKLVSRSEDYT